MSKRMEYRPDIDGLRALAVLSVLFYHVGFSVFPGGFVGVDVFFVISGYLITRIIINEVADGSFSFGRFYLRRARRLFPALFVTLFLTMLGAVWLFSPVHLERFGGAMVHSLASLSNVYFWTESGYFDASASVKPLLHTWSLSVEEQYYLFWPLLLVFLLKRKTRHIVPASLLFLFAVSLYLNYVFYDGEIAGITGEGKVVWTKLGEWFSDGRSSIFYLLPFRVFEFAVGAAVVYLESYKFKVRGAYEVLNALGMALIFYAVFAFDDKLVFPGYHALLPVIGAALVIYAGGAKYTGRLLSNNAMVSIGLISYSIYLVHWPMVVFTTYYSRSDLNLTQQIVIVVLSLILAYFMFKFIEQPFRRPRVSAESESAGAGDSGFVLVMLLLVVSLYVPSSNIWANSGWTWRGSEFQVQMRQKMRLYSKGRKRMVRGGSCHLNKKGRSFTEHLRVLKRCIPDGDAYVVVVGDSHAADVFAAVKHALSKRDRTLEVVQFTGAGCALRSSVKRCEQLHEYAFDWIRQNSERVESIVYTSRGMPLIHDKSVFQLETSRIRHLASMGVPLLLVGPRVEFANPAVLLSNTWASSPEMFYSEVEETKEVRYFQLDSRLRAFSDNLSSDGLPVRYFSSVEAICDDGRCVMGTNGEFFYVDNGHLSPPGMRYLGKRLSSHLIVDDSARAAIN